MKIFKSTLISLSIFLSLSSFTYAIEHYPKQGKRIKCPDASCSRTWTTNGPQGLKTALKSANTHVVIAHPALAPTYVGKKTIKSIQEFQEKKNSTQKTDEQKEGQESQK